MGIRKEKVRQLHYVPQKENIYYNGVLGSDLAAPVMCPDILGLTGRKLHEFEVVDRKDCVKKNLVADLTPSQLFTKAGLSRKVRK